MFLHRPFLIYGAKFDVSPILKEFQFNTFILNTFPLIDEGLTTNYFCINSEDPTEIIILS